MGKRVFSFDDYVNNRSTTNESYSYSNRTVDANGLKEMLEQAYESKERGNQVKPIFIYNDPETGKLRKTSIVKEAADRLGVDMLVVDSPSATMEDFLGIPKFLGGESTGRRSDSITIFPMDNGSDDKGGFILLNDMDKANGYILNGIMQFVQTGKIRNYQLPDKWVIVATGDSELDYAMADRFRIVNLVPPPQRVTDTM
jgi:MoxR-like ATPase